jgi:hypothetical protein
LSRERSDEVRAPSSNEKGRADGELTGEKAAVVAAGGTAPPLVRPIASLVEPLNGSKTKDLGSPMPECLGFSKCGPFLIIF